MSLIWLVPVVVLVLGAVALAAAGRVAAHEARAMVAELARLGEVHLALTQVHHELRRRRDPVDGLR